MKGIRRALSLVMVLLMMVPVLAGCGSSDSNSGTSEQATADSFKTLGDVFARELEAYSISIDQNEIVVSFKILFDDTYYCVHAYISDEDSQAYRSIAFYGDGYEEDEAKEHEILDPLEITEVEILNEQMLSQEELDTLVGKTGKELADIGWDYDSFYDPESKKVIMYYGPFEYYVIFDGSIEENSDIEEATQDMKVVSVEFNGL